MTSRRRPGLRVVFWVCQLREGVAIADFRPDWCSNNWVRSSRYRTDRRSRSIPLLVAALLVALASLLVTGCGLGRSNTPSRADNYRTLVLTAEAKRISGITVAGVTGGIHDIVRMCQYSGSVLDSHPEVQVIWDAGSKPGMLALAEVMKGLERLGYRVVREIEPQFAGQTTRYYLRLGEAGLFEVDVRRLDPPTGDEVLARIRLAESPC